MRPFATALSATPPARQTFVEAGASLCLADGVQVRLLEHRLQRAGDVLVVLRQLALRLARRAEGVLELGREDAADRRRAVAPRHVDALRVVREVVEI